jgi:ketosteroid isomerase-like protein
MGSAVGEDAGPVRDTARAMSTENVEVVKRLMDAINRRDVDTLAELTTSDFEWFPVFAARVGGDPYRGREGIETFLGEVDETWAEFRPVPEEYRDLGDRVLGLGQLKTRGRGSGVPTDSPWGGVYDLRGGEVSRIRTYLDHGEALRAAGLSVDGGSPDPEPDPEPEPEPEGVDPESAA